MGFKSIYNYIEYHVLSKTIYIILSIINPQKKKNDREKTLETTLL